ncbi:MAG: hypothetical protein ACP6KW_01820 [Candidatus Thorarchaeota archaeon]
MQTRHKAIALFLITLFLLPPLISEAQGYATEITPTSGRQVEIEWIVKKAPSSPFQLFFSKGGFWNSTNNSRMFFTMINITEDVIGELIIGNATVTANDTMIARDLVLGVWGLTEWWPGLIIETDSTSIEDLNETAYAAAARVSGNYQNGTMVSYYDNVTAGEAQYSCIVFEYVQDPTGYSEPQETYLAYSLETGILIKANTSYSFGTPYLLELEYSGYRVWTSWGVLDYALMAGIVILLAGVVIVIQRRMKK